MKGLTCPCGGRLMSQLTRHGDPEGLRSDERCAKCAALYGRTAAGLHRLGEGRPPAWENLRVFSSLLNVWGAPRAHVPPNGSRQFHVFGAFATQRAFLAAAGATAHHFRTFSGQIHEPGDPWVSLRIAESDPATDPWAHPGALFYVVDRGPTSVHPAPTEFIEAAKRRADK